MSRASKMAAALLVSLAAAATAGSAAAYPAPVLGGQTMVAASMASALPRTLAAHFSDAVNAADFGMKCDGVTNDTAAFNTVLQVSAGMTGGAELDLPAGRCMLAGTGSITTAVPLWIRGRGRAATSLVSTGTGDVLDLSVKSGAAVTISDLMVTRAAGTLRSGTTVSGTGVSIAEQVVNSLGSAGQVSVQHVTIQPPVASGQTDGFATGLSLVATTDAVISDVQVFMPGSGWSTIGATSLPSPTQPTVTTPSSVGYNVADGIYLGGSGGAFSIDTDVNDVTVTGGLAGVDIGPATQGVYVKGSKFVADVYGIRSISNGTSNELLTATLNHFNDVAAGVYLNGMSDSLVSNNFFFHFGNSLPWQAVWLQNGGANTVTGNSAVGNGSVEAQPSMGIALTNDTAGGFGGFPDTVSGNVVFNTGGPCLYNNANMTTIVGAGNDLTLCNQSTSSISTLAVDDMTLSSAADPWNVTRAFGANLYAANNTGYPTIIEDGNGGIKVRRNLFVGGPYDTGIIDVESKGAGTFYVDGSGNVTATGTVQAPSVAATVGTVLGPNANHAVHSYSLQGYASSTFVLTTNYATPASSNLPAPLPTQTAAGEIGMTGDVVCWNASYHQMWHFSGMWSQTTAGVLANTTFNATESDGQVVPNDGWGLAASVFNNVQPELQMTGSTTNVDCTASVTEILTQ